MTLAQQGLRRGNQDASVQGGRERGHLIRRKSGTLVVSLLLRLGGRALKTSPLYISPRH
jgi:hypothetical protein